MSPTILILFGATGNLATKKLLPALLDLYDSDNLPEHFRVVAFSRRDWTDEQYRDFVKKQSFKQNKHGHSRRSMKTFLQTITHFKGDFDVAESFTQLAGQLREIEKELGGCVNKLFYLAVPPQFYTNILQQLAGSKAAEKCSDAEGWNRILIEKPFGRDAQSAHELEQLLCKLFREEQIFRIDHYLAKETIQNILLFRFSNALFRPLWNKENIASIHLQMYEEKGLEGRVTFYDGVGALRDVGQNHILQMLSLVTMEDPGDLSAQAVRAGRAAILQNIRLFDMPDNIVRAQYKGYPDEEGIDSGSTTETFFRLRVEIDTDTWRGVPITLESGKALDRSEAKIIVKFKPTTSTVCSLEDPEKCKYQNQVTFKIQPSEGIEVVFWAKKPGFTSEMTQKKLSFNYYDTDDWQTFPGAYQHVLYYGMQGDQLLFPSAQEEKAQWDFISPILDDWGGTELLMYDKGSNPHEIKL